MKIINRILLSLFILLMYPVNHAGAQEVPQDSLIRTGKLDNGMTYYIRHNEEPKERASFYIIQNVGALLEEDNQNGLAHFLEHMSFNGTEHFPGKGIINTLEKHGVAFGRNINAYTSFNETVYNLSEVPVTAPGLVDTCLLILKDWSNYLLLTEEEIDAERGVISEEWRTRRNAGFRMRSQYFPALVGDSKFAVRDVIGDLDVINNFEYETLRKFYHDWYRTDLQAIAIAGDIDVAATEEKVIKLFSSIPAVDDARPRPFFAIPEHNETRFVVAKDPEASQNIINIFIKHNGTPAAEKGLDYLRYQYISRLFNMMTGARITELLQEGNPPFIMGNISYGNFLRGYEALNIAATSGAGDEATALKAIYTETERLKRHGFMPGELQRAKANLLTAMKSTYEQRDKISNDTYISGMQDHFLNGEPLTSPETDWELGQLILQSIELNDINAAKDKWISKENRVIIIMGTDEAEHLSKEESLAIMNEVEQSKVDPYEDTEIASTLVPYEIEGAKIVSTRKLTDFDAVEWTLSNNARVIYKHADYEKDKVSIRGFSKGGMSKVNTDELPTAMMLSQFMGSFGAGDFDAIALRNALTGKKVMLQINLGALSENVVGSASPRDFETLMQLLYLKFEKPRFDRDAYEALLSRYKAYLPNIENDPQKIMSDSMQLILTGSHPRTKIMNTGFMDQVRFEDMNKIYTERVNDAGDFVFFIVGNIDEETARKYSEKYIGSLEDNSRTESWVNHNIDQPKGHITRKIAIPLETEKASVIISINSDYDYSPAENIYLSILESILDLRYTEEIREKEGGTYGVSVNASNQHYPAEDKTIVMNFDTDPARADYLKEIIYREIELIAKNGPTKDDLDKTVKNLRKDREQSKEHNNYWMNTIYNFYFHGIDYNKPDNYETILDEVNTRDIKKFTSKFLKKADIAEIIFLPKEKNQ